MTIEMLEGAVDAVADYLQDNVAAKVAELNARYADSYELSEPVEWYLGELPTALPQVPSVAILALNWNPTMPRAANIDADSRLDIYVFEGGDQLEARFRKLSRFAVGILEMIRTGEQTIGYVCNLAGPVTLTDVLDSPTFLQAIIMPWMVGKSETY